MNNFANVKEINKHLQIKQYIFSCRKLRFDGQLGITVARFDMYGLTCMYKL